MITALAKLVANLVGLGWDTAAAAAQRYVRLAVGSMLAGLVAASLLYVGAVLHSDALVAAGAVLLMLVLVVMYVMAAPVSILAEAASSRWPLIRTRVDGVCQLVMQGLLIAFYFMSYGAARHPRVVMVVSALYALGAVALILPTAVGPAALFRQRVSKHLMTGVTVILLTAWVVPESWRLWILTPPGILHPDELQFTIDDADRLVEPRSGVPIQLFRAVNTASAGPEPLVGFVYHEARKRYRLFKWYPGQTQNDPEGVTIQPLTPELVESIKIQSRRDRESRQNPSVPIAGTRAGPHAQPKPGVQPTGDSLKTTVPEPPLTPQVPPTNDSRAESTVQPANLTPNVSTNSSSDSSNSIADEVAWIQANGRLGGLLPASAQQAKSVTSGRSVVLRWSRESRQLAADLYSRLRGMDVMVTAAPLADSTERRPSVEYVSDLHEVAVALRSAMIDVVRLELNSHAFRRDLEIVLP